MDIKVHAYSCPPPAQNTGDGHVSSEYHQKSCRVDAQRSQMAEACRTCLWLIVCLPLEWPRETIKFKVQEREAPSANDAQPPPTKPNPPPTHHPTKPQSHPQPSRTPQTQPAETSAPRSRPHLWAPAAGAGAPFRGRRPPPGAPSRPKSATTGPPDRGDIGGLLLPPVVPVAPPKKGTQKNLDTLSPCWSRREGVGAMNQVQLSRGFCGFGFP